MYVCMYMYMYVYVCICMYMYVYVCICMYVFMYVLVSNYVVCLYAVGVSVIPNGLHFVYHSTGMGSRQGFFVYAKKNDIIVTSWDPGNEEIVIIPLLSEAGVENLKNGVRRGDLNAQLGPYPLAMHSNWLNLTGLVTEGVLARADVHCGTLVFPGDADDDAHLAVSESTAVKPYFPGLARIARLSPLKDLEEAYKKTVSETPDISADEVSRQQMDKSSFLATLVEDHFNGSYEELLGELQLSFVLFMMIYSYPALEHWKRLINILCQCEDTMLAKPAFYAVFLRVLYEQLGYSPDDFFHTELSHENFLRPTMTSLFQMLNAEGLHPTLEEHRKRLLTFMRKKFNLFEENAGEEYLKDADVPMKNLQGASSSFAPSADELYNLVGEDRPVVVCLDANGNEEIVNRYGGLYSNSAPLREVDPKDVEKEKFGWRYPFLFDAMDTNEDMTMAAVRLIELSLNEEEMAAISSPMSATSMDTNTNTNTTAETNVVTILPMALQEARLFIENELPLFASSRLV
jgi:A1 cistron-splicing factor AAR2